MSASEYLENSKVWLPQHEFQVMKFRSLQLFQGIHIHIYILNSHKMLLNEKTMRCHPATMTDRKCQYAHHCNLTRLLVKQTCFIIINFDAFNSVSVLDIGRDFSVTDIICLFRTTNELLLSVRKLLSSPCSQTLTTLHHFKIFNSISLFTVNVRFLV